MLQEKGIPHQLLNAKPENIKRESEIVAQAGRLYAVTVSTNMAGRGTDILLGGNPDFARQSVYRLIVDIQNERGLGYLLATSQVTDSLSDEALIDGKALLKLLANFDVEIHEAFLLQNVLLMKM